MIASGNCAAAIIVIITGSLLSANYGLCRYPAAKNIEYPASMWYAVIGGMLYLLSCVCTTSFKMVVFSGSVYYQQACVA